VVGFAAQYDSVSLLVIRVTDNQQRATDFNLYIESESLSAGPAALRLGVRSEPSSGCREGISLDGRMLLDGWQPLALEISRTATDSSKCTVSVRGGDNVVPFDLDVSCNGAQAAAPGTRDIHFFAGVPFASQPSAVDVDDLGVDVCSWK
jgi:hypothetical protein